MIVDGLRCGAALPGQISHQWVMRGDGLQCRLSYTANTQCAILAEAQPRQIVRIKEALDSLFTNNIEMENDKTSTGLYRSCAAF